MLFKNTCIEPWFPKNKILNQFVLKTQTLNTFYIKIKEVVNEGALALYLGCQEYESNSLKN